MTVLQKYWTKLLFFGAILIVYIIGVAPDMTWMSLGGDAFDYVVGAENNWAVRPTGYPTYIMLGWVFERLPGNDFWSLGLISALSSFVTCIFIFLTVRYLVRQSSESFCDSSGPSGVGRFTTSFLPSSLPARLAPYIGAATYAGAFIVWTQSVIPEVYTITAACMVAGTYFVLQKRYWLAVLALAIGLGTHHLILLAVVPLMVYVYSLEKDKWLLVKLCSVGSLGLLPYLQTQFCIVGQETASGLGSGLEHSLNSLGVVFTLPIEATWQRISEAGPVLISSLGVGLVLLLLIPTVRVWRYIPIPESREIRLLAVLAILPIVYYLFSNIPMWTTYTVPGVAFACILIGFGASKLSNTRWLHPGIFLVLPMVFMVFNLLAYDIGRTIDESPTSAREFYNSLEELPDDSILYITSFGEPWLTTHYYRITNNYRIDFVYEGQLRFYPEGYTARLTGRGINFPEDLDKYGEKELSTVNTMYKNWDSRLFLKDFWELNLDKDIYLCEPEKGADTVEDNVFGITMIDAVDLEYSLIP